MGLPIIAVEHGKKLFYLFNCASWGKTVPEHGKVFHLRSSSMAPNINGEKIIAKKRLTKMAKKTYLLVVHGRKP